MAKSKKPSLKATLSSAQARLKKKKQAEDATLQALNHRAKGVSRKGMAKTQIPQRSAIPFDPSDHILLIGEGDFSFASALLQRPPAPLEHLPPANIIATAYDTEDECYAKYTDAEQNVRVLREKGTRVIFSVDATRLEKTSALKGKVFDRIAWNFPHAGKGITDQDRNVLSNQVLILGFLRSAAKFLVRGPVPQLQSSRKRKRLSDDDGDELTDEGDNQIVGVSGRRRRGTVLITLRNVPPYTEWDVPKLAKNPPPPRSSVEPPNPHYILFRSFGFDRNDWNGYKHRMTKGERARGQGKTGEGGEDRTWEFFLKNE
ncbi:hypothetical protein F5148DRAFT_1273351 [Russula earlei]|uniref:Uncharacterized protein n=1 Tax=Russula earlei TaxID=71964 RepID=A0ACC0UNJ8_9AGAM|nr:hypothetical protein F5148DRAFT_1273351 [Russula earlei]